MDFGYVGMVVNLLLALCTLCVPGNSSFKETAGLVFIALTIACALLGGIVFGIEVGVFVLLVLMDAIARLRGA